MTQATPDRADLPSETPQSSDCDREKPSGALPGSGAAVGGDGASTDPGSEREVWSGRTHWQHFAGRLATWALGNTALFALLAWFASGVDWLSFGGTLWITVGLLVVSGAVLVWPVIATILGCRYRLTSQRLFIVRGILSQTHDQTELIRVDDVQIHKTLLDRVFGLGSIAVTSTDATDHDLLVKGIRNPEKLAEAIRNHTRALRAKSLYVENL